MPKGTSYMYTDGNTVRKLNTIPKEAPKRVKKRPRTSEQVRRNQETVMAFDLSFTLFLATFVLLATLSCVSYLKVQAKVLQQTKTVAAMEVELNKLQCENDAAKERLNSAVDLSYIYKVATKELGMVYPSNNQVIYYESSHSDYVKQYEDIPEAN